MWNSLSVCLCRRPQLQARVGLQVIYKTLGLPRLKCKFSVYTYFTQLKQPYQTCQTLHASRSTHWIWNMYLHEQKENTFWLNWDFLCVVSGRVLVGGLGEHHALHCPKGDPGGCSCLWRQTTGPVAVWLPSTGLITWRFPRVTLLML